MKKFKSLLFTILVCGGSFGILYFTPISKGTKLKKVTNSLISSEDDEILSEDALAETPNEEVTIAPIITEEEILQPRKEEVKPEPIKEELATPQPMVSELKKEQLAPVKEAEKKDNNKQQKEPTKKIEEKKAEDPKKNTPPQKESKIGVDRKLISGIPGTMKYKGKLPGHNVKEKGSITISYTVDANGNVISAHRIDGIRSKNAINNAIYMIRKHVKAEKSKGNSTGTYTIEFK